MKTPIKKRRKVEPYINFLSQKKAEIIVCLIIVLLCQLVPTYEYYTIDRDLQKFRNDNIDNLEIKEIILKHYQPGKATDKYPEIKLENGVSYALVTENWNDQDLIKIGDRVSKNRLSSKVKINNDKLMTIKNLNSSKIFHRILMIIVSMFPIFILIFHSKKNVA